MNYWQLIVSITLYFTTLVGLTCYKRIKPTSAKVFVLWYIVWALADIGFYVYQGFFSNGNRGNVMKVVQITYCLLDPFYYLTYAYVFLLVHQPINLIQRFIWVVFVFFLSFSFYQLAHQLDERSIANDSFLIKSILILLIVLYYFWTLIQSNQIIIPSKEPLFWIATGSLFFFTGNIISSGFFHELFSYSKEWARILFKLSYILEIVLYLFSILAFVISSKRENNGR